MYKILIIDDSMEKTNEMIESIKQCDFGEVEIDYELEFRKASNILKEKFYDLLILDIQLPSIGSVNGMTMDGGVKILELVSDCDAMKKPMNIIGLTAFDEKYEEVAEKFNKRLFHLIKYDKTSSEWKRLICEKISYLIGAKRCEMEDMKNDNSSIDCAIITAVPTEFKAVKKCISTWEKREIDGDPTLYYYAELEHDEGIISIILAQQDQMGMVAASMLTTKLIEHFNPKLVAMLGIAGGCEGEVALGDILVASESWDYGSGKIVKDEDKNGYVLKVEPHQIRLDSSLKNFFFTDFGDMLYEIRKRWNNNFGDNKNNDILVKIGPVVSGAAVIKESELVKEYILPQNRKVIGIDMETYAVYYAASSVKNHKPSFISMKAVSDFADKYKDDKYQAYAAYVSAEFFFANINRLIEIIKK